jgi:hypothetical protein
MAWRLRAGGAQARRRRAPRAVWAHCLALAVPLCLAMARLPRATAQALPPAPEQCTPDIVSRVAWGVGTGAHQFEGAGPGRAPSVWEAFTKANPGAIADRTDARTGADFYNRFRTDIQLLQKLGVSGRASPAACADTGGALPSAACRGAAIQRSRGMKGGGCRAGRAGGARAEGRSAGARGPDPLPIHLAAPIFCGAR